eukprot:TRINITY_DN2841_c0_g1_i1.p1 TRINITY_DN2841_c0_g1~~TRINITY_DN2841_c0_g1_i1.p1  ORF type:complete len:283 (+),score=45.54 TRINITY_DN2841_c0_g1_i1:71-850(+)
MAITAKKAAELFEKGDRKQQLAILASKAETYERDGVLLSTFIIGCWTGNADQVSDVFNTLEQLAQQPSVVISGGDPFEKQDLSDGPVVAEATKRLLDNGHHYHFAFQHMDHVEDTHWFPANTYLLPHHASLSDGKRFYSGTCPETGEVKGALRDVLDFLEEVSVSTHIQAVFLGGGTVAENELKTLIKLGCQGELKDEWTLAVLPLASAGRSATDYGLPYVYAETWVESQTSETSQWHVESFDFQLKRSAYVFKLQHSA